MATVDMPILTFATGATLPGTPTPSQPDSIAIAGNFVWVAYTGGTSSTGQPGFPDSTIVEYKVVAGQPGQFVQSFDIAGNVDGLKFNPTTGDIWALQNQDGNSTLTIIDPQTGSVSDPIPYQIPSSSRGYDDVVFSDGKTFLSYTNPTTGDPTVVELLNGEGNGLGSGSQRSLVTKTVLTDGVSGFNTVDKKMEPVPQNDPDSLKLAPNGDLLLTSGDDGTIIDISNPGTPGQTVAFTQVTDKAGTPVSALDDVIKPNATAGTFYISDTAQNEVLAVHVSGLNLNDYYASVGSLNAFGEIDPTTGVFTPLVSATTTPGFPGFASPHGVEFVADATNPTAQLGQSMASFGPAAANNSTLLGSSSQVAQLVQVMAGFGGGSGAADGLNTAPLSAETSQQQLLTTPQHA